MPQSARNEREIFIEARGMRDPAEREAFVAQACGDDTELRERVQALLAQPDQFGSFLELAPVRVAATIDLPEISERPGTVIGPYKLMEQIGEGGMGLVFVAEQQEPVRRKVALKIIKPGMDTREIIARFEAERQALALMEHPNIARVFDAGTTGESEPRTQRSGVSGLEADESPPTDDVPLTPLRCVRGSGRPYFVMELVKGIPIVEYCDQQQLTARERLKLFLDVCHAVQHAHGKGIIHRDLKPSNILVAPHDGVPVVKVIDFGVAKAIGQQLTEKTIYTRFSQMIGTPLYMSPEQAELNALDVDIRSDIYSLGVLLYELLTGTTPFDRERFKRAAYDEIRRIIREEEPPKPSTRLSELSRVGRVFEPHQSEAARGDGAGGSRRLDPPYAASPPLAAVAARRRIDPAKLTKLVRGELDWIVMKCLEKDRTRRYETSNSLAQDLQRYLDDKPVEAGPPSAVYRLRKFVRRHQGPVLAASLLLLVLIGGIVGTTWGLIRAASQRDRAVTAERRAGNEAANAKTERDAAIAAREEAVVQSRRADQESRTAWRQLYFSHMNLAQAAWESGGVGPVLDFLNRHRPQSGHEDLRGFEWHYLNRLAHSYQLNLKGHTEQISSVAFSPDGKRLASVSGNALDTNANGELKIWDAITGRELFTMNSDGGGIWSAAFSPDGSRLATAHEDKTVRIWDPATGEVKRTLMGHSLAVVNLAYSADGKWLASAGFDSFKRSEPGEVKVWDVVEGREALTIHDLPSGVVSVALSPDGKRLAYACYADSTVKLWDVASRQETHTIETKREDVAGLAFSPDGTRLAAACGYFVKAWDAASGEETLSLNHNGKVWGITFSPDGTRLASACHDQIVRVWDAVSGQVILALRGHTNAASAVAFGPDGRRLATGSWDRTVKVWEAVRDTEPIAQNQESDPANSTSFSPDRRHFALGTADFPEFDRPGVVTVCDVANGRELFRSIGHLGPIWSVAFSPDGTRLASASGRIQEGAPPGEVKLWDASNGHELFTLKGRCGPVWDVAFSPDGRWLASASGNSSGETQSGEVQVWDASNGQELFTMQEQEPLSSVTFSPDGKSLATAGETAVKLWDTATRQLKMTLPCNSRASQSALAFSPDGKLLASTSDDNSVKVWDVPTGLEKLTLHGHADSVSRVAFSPDGNRLATVGGDLAVKLWDVTSGHVAITLRSRFLIIGVTFSPDGNRIVSANAMGKSTIWDATPLEPGKE